MASSVGDVTDNKATENAVPTPSSVLVPCYPAMTVKTSYTQKSFDEFVMSKSILCVPASSLSPYAFLARGNSFIGQSRMPIVVGDISYQNPLFDHDGAVKIGKWLFVMEATIRPIEDAHIANNTGTLPPLNPANRSKYSICAFHVDHGHHTIINLGANPPERPSFFLLRWVLVYIAPWLYCGHGLEVVLDEYLEVVLNDAKPKKTKDPKTNPIALPLTRVIFKSFSDPEIVVDELQMSSLQVGLFPKPVVYSNKKDTLASLSPSP